MIGHAGLTPLRFYLYNDPRPFRGKSTPIQKGVVPSLDDGGTDLCEEGIGFGVPVLQCTRDFFFSGTACAEPEGEIRQDHAQKSYRFDLIERVQADSRHVGKFTWVSRRLFLDIFKSTIGRKVLDTLEFLLPKRQFFYHAPPAFIRVPSHGSVQTTYRFQNNFQQIRIHVDLSGVNKKNVEKIFISNELGGSAFIHYRDGRGCCRVGNEIGQWNRIDAPWAIFYAPTLRIGFRVEIPPHVEAFRGRETTSPELCWSGVIFGASPNVTQVEYSVTFGSLRELMEVEPSK